MNSQKNKKSLLLKGLLFVSMGLVACGDNRAPEEIVKERALARWAIRLEGKIDGLYEFISPAQKQMYDKETYEKRFGSMVKYLQVNVQEVSCPEPQDDSPAVCEVKIYVDFETLGNVKTKMGNLITEKWIEQDKQWWISQ